MALIKCCAVVLAAFWVAPRGASGAGPVTLREVPRVGETTRASVSLKAEGLYRPASPPGSAAKDGPKPLALKVETRLEFVERVLAVDAGGRPSRSGRRVLRAGSAVNGGIRPQAATLRPSVALLVAEPRSEGVVVWSPLGPLTRSELELVQGPGDPLALEGLLPVRPVEPGDRWKVGDSAARALTAYDVIGSNGLEATLAAVDGATATVKLKGEVRGSVLGGEGTMAVDGSYTFDLKAGRVSALAVDRRETRGAGPVEAGLDVKGSLVLDRRAEGAVPTELTDETLGRLGLDKADPSREFLLLDSPDGTWSLTHDRDWHTYWDDPRLTLLKRLDRGEVVAQCNLSKGPQAGQGRHQDTEQFRADVRKGLGERFVQFLGAGELDGDPAGHFRYKVGVQGRQGDVGVLWYYDLVASPAGDQVVATFTLAASRQKSFGDEDERLIKTFRWKPAADAGVTGR